MMPRPPFEAPKPPPPPPPPRTDAQPESQYYENWRSLQCATGERTHQEALAWIETCKLRFDGLRRQNDALLAALRISNHTVSTYYSEGTAGEILTALQDGTISRAKAAEALSELAQGRQPEFEAPSTSEFGYMECPGDVARQLRAEIEELKRQIHATKEEKP